MIDLDPNLPTQFISLKASSRTTMVNVHRQRRDLNTKHTMRRTLKVDSRVSWTKKIPHATLVLCAVLFLSVLHIRRQDLYLSDSGERGRFMGAIDDSSEQVIVKLPDTTIFSAISKPIENSANNSSAVSNSPYPEFPIKEFLPNRDPVFPRKLIKEISPNLVQVHLLFGSSESISAQSRFLLEGVERSSVLQLTHVSFLEQNNQVSLIKMNDQKHSLPLIWMVDMIGIEHDCHLLEMLIRHALSLDDHDPKNNNPEWRRLLLIDYSGSSSVASCTNVLNEFWSESRTLSMVRIVKRGVIEGRHWSFSKDWVDPGNVMPYDGFGIDITYSPLALREAIVREVSTFIEKQKKDLNLTKLRPVDVKRMNDVVHFWRMGDNAHYTFLRAKVSSLVNSMNGVDLGSRSLKTLVRTIGEEEFMENNTIQGRYIEEMMSTKAIVIAQRDEWEDHYRLMESLATGALVLTDTMIGLPQGLVPGKNIVVYNSTDSLKEMLMYYLDPSKDKERLSIAKKGWEVAMGHHRCWHRVEEIVFGTAITAVDHVYDHKPPPKTGRLKYKAGDEGIKLVEIPMRDKNNKINMPSFSMKAKNGGQSKNEGKKSKL